LRSSAGLTLWELLCTLLIAGVVLGLGVPSFHSFVLDARRIADVNGFVRAAHLARSEAVKRAQPVVLCQSFDGLTCGNSERYDAGWIVYVDTDQARPPQRSPDEPLLWAHAPRTLGSIRGNREIFEFRPFLVRSTNGTLTFCDERGPSAARAVIVSYTGRPRTAAVDPAGNPLQCAGFP
jgi:type IV fimbrial biogenesis protein FimT